MVRKYDIKNKRYFIIVGIIFLILISIFSFFVYKFKSIEKLSYNVYENSYLLDNKNNYFSTKSDGILKKKWTGNYYFVYGDDNIKNFGDHVIVYNNKICLYGKYYEVLENGEVSILDGENKLNNNITSFYKLDDRKYLVVSPIINSSDDSISAKNFLLVELDKQGNAKLTNNEVNLKTVNKTFLVTNLYSFDISGEKLVIGDETIDLKKIIGSSNEYKNDNKNNDITDNNSNSNNIQSLSENISIDNNIVNNNEINNESVNNNIKNAVTSVLSVSSSYSSIKCNYVIYDPSKQYTSIYVDVFKDNGLFIKRVNLSRDSNDLVIDNLDYNTSYKLYFRYTLLENNEEVSKVFYEQFIKTKNVNFTIKVTKISTLESTINYEIKFDGDFLLEVVKSNSIIVFNTSIEAGSYFDNQSISRNVTSGDVYDSIKGVFNIPNLNAFDIVTLKLNSFNLDGQVTNISDVTYKYQNS